MIILYLVKII